MLEQEVGQLADVDASTVGNPALHVLRCRSDQLGLGRVGAVPADAAAGAAVGGAWGTVVIRGLTVEEHDIRDPAMDELTCGGCPQRSGADHCDAMLHAVLPRLRSINAW